MTPTTPLHAERAEYAEPGIEPVDETAPAFVRRMRPTSRSGITYLWALFGALLFIGLLAVVNIMFPLGNHALRRTTWSFAIIFLGWAIGLAMLLLQHVRAFRPAVLFSVGAVPFEIVVGVLAVWNLGPRDIMARAFYAVLLLFVFTFLAAAAVEVFARGLRRAPALFTLAVLAVAGTYLAIVILARDPAPRLTESAWRGAIPIILGSLILLLPEAKRRWVPLVAWAAWAQFAVVGALDPWVSGALSDRMNAAGLLLLGILGLAALTAALIPAQRPAEESRGSP